MSINSVIGVQTCVGSRVARTVKHPGQLKKQASIVENTGGSHPSVHPQRNGYTEHGLSTQWNIIQP